MELFIWHQYQKWKKKEDKREGPLKQICQNRPPPDQPSDQHTILVMECFGGFNLSVNNTYISLHNKKATELIAYLACENGRNVRKMKAASELWPATSSENARDCLYKVIRYIQGFNFDGVRIPLCNEREYLRLDMSRVWCDLTEFSSLYAGACNIENYKKAVELYRGILLMNEGYEWANQYDAFFDVRFIELATFLSEHYASEHNYLLSSYYRKKIN